MSRPSEMKQSDEEILGAVSHAINRSGHIRVADVVHVEVNAGIVLLSGVVDTFDEKQAAEDVARRVPGVRFTVNRLTVATGGHVSDGELRAAVLAALARQPEPIRQVGCRVDDGVVTLLGRIRDAADERRAREVAGNVAGVKLVESALVIVPEAAHPGP